MADQIVFQESETLTVATEVEEDSTLVFVTEPLTAISDLSDADALVIVDSPRTTLSEETLAGDTLIVSVPKATEVVSFESGGEILQIMTGGPAGPPGAVGPVGPPGANGVDGETPVLYEGVFNFASPVTTWTLVHNQNTKALSVVTLDTNSEVILGDVVYTNTNTITVTWFYPTSGTALVFE